MLALVTRGLTAVFATPRRVPRSEQFRGIRVRFAASSSSDNNTTPPTGTIVDPKPVGQVKSSAHKGPAVKRTAQRVAPRRTSNEPEGNGTNDDSQPQNFEFHRKNLVKRFVKRAEPKSNSSVFPYTHDEFDFDGFHATARDIEKAFGPLVSPERIARLESVIDQRTFDLMPVLEGVYDIGNVLAVCRSAEALGVGCLGVISDSGLAFKQSGRTSGGAVKWTHLDQWRSTKSAIGDLKSRGYRVLVTVFEGGHPLEEYDWSIPTAVVLGNEREGVSEEAKELADGGVYISMSGFTESLNVSVASSLTMHHATQDRKKRSPKNCSGNLSDREKATLRSLYLAKLVPNYSRQGYLRQLLERSAARGGDESYEQLDSEEDSDTEILDEVSDEVSLLNALEVAKIVKRPRKMKFGRPVKDDHTRIMQEVELAPEREHPEWDKNKRE